MSKIKNIDVILIHADGCIHCKNFEPHYNTVKNKIINKHNTKMRDYKKLIKFHEIAVDGVINVKNKIKELIGRHKINVDTENINVDGYPTVLMSVVFNNNKNMILPVGLGNDKDNVDKEFHNNLFNQAEYFNNLKNDENDKTINVQSVKLGSESINMKGGNAPVITNNNIDYKHKYFLYKQKYMSLKKLMNIK